MIVEATGNVRRLGSTQAGQDATKFERIVKVIIASSKIESRAGEGGGGGPERSGMVFGKFEIGPIANVKRSDSRDRPK